MIVVHVLAGTVALLAAVVALVATKGAGWHRRGGVAYAVSMLVMAISGSLIAAFQGKPLSVIAGLLAGYLVVTGWLTVRRSVERMRAVLIVGLLVALGVGVAGLGFGVTARLAHDGRAYGMSGAPYVVFGSVALIGAALDARLVRVGHIAGRARLARHLWRLLAALVMANAAFFLGQADEFPDALRQPVLLAVPVIVSLLLIPYWLVRVLRGGGAAAMPNRLRAGGA